MDRQTLFKRYLKKAKEKSDHAVLSASGSERWLSCPGSIQLAKKHKLITQDNEWSIAGTHAHTLLQFILENEDWIALLASKEAKNFKEHIGYSPEQLRSVLVAVRYVKSEWLRLHRQSGNAPQLLIEKKMELPGVGFGTSDIILYQPFGLLHVMDYKNGKYKVDPEENTQGLYYAVAAAELFGWDVAEIWITIIQPNVANASPIRTWKTNVRRLEIAQARFLSGAAATQNPQARFVIDGKYCWFCPGRQVCPEQLKVRTGKALALFER